MKLHIPCAYCKQIITYSLKGNNELTMKGRKLVFDNRMKCPTCGSVTVVEISTKRKSKGKEQRESELAATEVERAAIRQRAILNKKLGEALLAQPGCTCAPLASTRPESTHLGEASGHPLSTGWSREARTGHMLPTKPRHFHFCPLFGSSTEADLLDNSQEIL